MPNLFFNYLTLLPKSELNKCYQYAHFGKFIYNILPDNAKKFIDDLSNNTILPFLLSKYENQNVMQLLIDLLIIEVKETENNIVRCRMSDQFIKCRMFPLKSEVLDFSTEERCIASLDQCNETLSHIEHYLMGLSDDYDYNWLTLLENMEFVQRRSPQRPYKVLLRNGIIYLLSLKIEQVWGFIKYQLEDILLNGKNFGEYMDFIIRLSVLKLGCGITGLSTDLVRYLEDLENVGLLAKYEMIWFPTRRFLNFAYHLNNGSCEVKDQKFLYVSANKTVYAMTNSLMDQCKLTMFSDFVDYSVQGMLVNKITEAKMIKLFQFGITAADVIKFLNTHNQSKYPIPESVTLELIAWNEKCRKNFIGSGYLISVKMNEHIFISIRDFAARNNALLWETKKNQKLFIATHGFYGLKSYLISLGVSFPPVPVQGRSEKETPIHESENSQKHSQSKKDATLNGDEDILYSDEEDLKGSTENEAPLKEEVTVVNETSSEDDSQPTSDKEKSKKISQKRSDDISSRTAKQESRKRSCKDIEEPVLSE